MWTAGLILRQSVRHQRRVLPMVSLFPVRVILQLTGEGREEWPATKPPQEGANLKSEPLPQMQLCLLRLDSSEQTHPLLGTPARIPPTAEWQVF